MHPPSVKIQRLHSDAHIPSYQTKGAAGFDLHALESCEILPKSRGVVRTGLAMEIQEGFELQIRPRSGLALRHGISVLNAPGTIDSDYRGEIMIILINHSDTIFLIQKGDRIAQGVISPVYQVAFEEVQALTPTVRGSKGFGSSGVSE